MNWYRTLLRPLLFILDPERAHHLIFSFLEIIFSIPGVRKLFRTIYSFNHSSLRRNVLGIHFPNPVGLAAGFDKDAKLYPVLSEFGFGFIEVGTVTPVAQPGNDKPRMFRLVSDEALINRMGFNNQGVESMIKNLAGRKNIIIGINIGKNKNTPVENAADDYEFCFRKLFNSADYFAVNVSSPNTPGLRNLQDKEPLMKILTRLQKVNEEFAAKGEKSKPVLLKIAPDLSTDQLDEIIEVIFNTRLDGVIATNTTLSRTNLRSSDNLSKQVGGLSGKPLKQRSTEIIEYLKARSQNRFIIIGAGGIHSAADAIEKIKAGADLIQLYTGFIYEGPCLVKQIGKALTTR